MHQHKLHHEYFVLKCFVIKIGRFSPLFTIFKPATAQAAVQQPRNSGLTFKKHIVLAAASAVLLSSFVLSKDASAAVDCGGASWYALTSRTASGERMNAALLTAAHRSMKFGTKLKVTNKHNGKSVIVRVNDRGPFIKGRVLDLSKAAAHRIGMVERGTANVCFQTVS